MTHPITKHSDGCCCPRCDLVEAGYDQHNAPVYAEPFPLDDRPRHDYTVIGLPTICEECTLPQTNRLSAEQRARLFVEAVESLAHSYGVVFKTRPKPSEAVLGLVSVDFTCTVAP